MYSLMYLQDSKLFMVCQVRNEDIYMSYVALFFEICFIIFFTKEC